MRRALQPQPPDMLGGRLSNNHNKKPIKVKRRETRAMGQLGQRETGIEVALDGDHRAHHTLDAHRRAATRPAAAPARIFPDQETAKSGMNVAPDAKMSAASSSATATPTSAPWSSGRSAPRAARKPKPKVE